MKKLVFVFLIILSSKLFAQRFISMHSFNDTVFKPYSFLNAKTADMNVVPSDFYSSHLPFFCGKELQMQKLTGVAVKLRLGIKVFLQNIKNIIITCFGKRKAKSL